MASGEIVEKLQARRADAEKRRRVSRLSCGILAVTAEAMEAHLREWLSGQIDGKSDDAISLAAGTVQEAVHFLVVSSKSYHDEEKRCDGELGAINDMIEVAGNG